MDRGWKVPPEPATPRITANAGAFPSPGPLRDARQVASVPPSAAASGLAARGRGASRPESNCSLAVVHPNHTRRLDPAPAQAMLENSQPPAEARDCEQASSLVLLFGRATQTHSTLRALKCPSVPDRYLPKPRKMRDRATFHRSLTFVVCQNESGTSSRAGGAPGWVKTAPGAGSNSLRCTARASHPVW